MVHLLLAVIYLAFISLGLPDGLLGAAWPVMYPELSVPVSGMGVVSVIISCGTITSSLLSDRLTRRLGTGKVMVVSVALTALALFGFSVSGSFWMLCLLAIPYGLGAGGVDAGLNNYVALHYSSRHMSWLHCMWGVGASVGPYVMGAVLTGGQHWSAGYRAVALLQIGLTALLLLSLPLWKGSAGVAEGEKPAKALSIRQIFSIPGAREVMIAFFCYCALEQTAAQWASSYLVLYKGVQEEIAASFASLFFVGITVGRAVNGFLTMKWNDTQLIRFGSAIIGVGVLCMLLPLGAEASLVGLVLIGLGCAPIYPCIIHSTPAHFGAENSQSVVGIQMASAYVGSLLMPPLFGVLAQLTGAGVLPVYLGAILLLMILMHEKLVKVTSVC